MLRVSAMVRIALAPAGNHRSVLAQIQDHCMADEIQFLAVIDALLEDLHSTVGTRITRLINQLEQYLRLGNSTWTIAPDRRSLTSRVDPTAEQVVVQVIAPQDAASDDLATAWRATYGREPDPSDAWDHSIKAVEHILKPVVCPNNAKATLGNVLGDLRSQPHRWKLVLPGTNGDFSVNRLVAMLELIWPNPDRHGGSTATVVALEQAQAVVHLAVTVVQWGRAGVLRRVP
jgi:hypothetical protein